MTEFNDKTLLLNPHDQVDVIKGLSSDIRIRILDLLTQGPKNVNDIAAALSLPQSTVATNVAVLEETHLISTETIKARKGSQKICSRNYNEIVIRFTEEQPLDSQGIQVAMPIGLYTNFEVSAPCGLCSLEKVIGYLDVPDTFLSPERMKASLLWFEKGWVEYKFPNNSLMKEKPVKKLELSMELSSETPGTDANLLSDITVWVNNIEIGLWTSPGDFGDKRGKLTPSWWKLEGSQYGLLKQWQVTEDGTYVDGVRVSEIKIGDLEIHNHHSIKVRIGVKEDAEHRGGINIFGQGFGNYDQDIVLQLFFE